MDAWEFFQNSNGMWRWRCTSSDGNVVVNSAEAHPLLVQAVAEAITHGFVERVSHEEQQVALTDLDALKLNYSCAFSAYESRLTALSQASSDTALTVLREDLAKAIYALECARHEYREALLLTAFGGSTISDK
jgi:hypothetical protein